MLAIMSGNMSAYASSAEMNIEDQKQDQIDEIFTELNELALATNQVLFSANTVATTPDLTYINDRQTELDQRLESLEVHKIDPNNSEDIAQLEEVMQHTLDTEMMNAPLATSEDGPNISTLAELFSVYQTSGARTISGTKYNYSYVRVIDNKGYGKLTQSVSDTTLIGKSSVQLSDMLKYNFSFGLDAFLGSLPYGWAASWLIGNVFSALDSYSSSSSLQVTCPSGKVGIYTMNMTSVTEMTYYFIYMPEYYDWILCGSKASVVSFAKAEAFTANIGGKAVSDSNDDQGSTSTGNTWSWYYDEFIRTRSNNYSPIGSLEIKGMNNYSKTFSPKYYNTFIGLY